MHIDSYEGTLTIYESGNPHLTINYKIRCPFCGNDQTGSTEETHLYAWSYKTNSAYDGNLVASAAELTEQRACGECGIVSVMPERQKDALFEYLRSTFSKESVAETVMAAKRFKNSLGIA